MNRRKTSRIGRARLGAIGLLACGGALGAASSVAHGSAVGAPKAKAAKTEAVNQTMSTSVSKIEGNTVIAKGQAVKGQIDGVVSFRLTLQNGARATSTFSIVDNGSEGGGSGSVQGVTSGHYHVSGALSYFTGGITSMHGTGKYAHAKNLGLHLTGTLNRRTFKLSARLKGELSR